MAGLVINLKFSNSILVSCFIKVSAFKSATSYTRKTLAPSFLSAHTSWAPCFIRVPDKSRVT